jgi:hypothetical protein
MLIPTVASLSNFKEVDRIQLPDPADTSQNEDRSSRVIGAQLPAINRHIEGDTIRVDRFPPQYPSLPNFGLGANRTTDKPGQLTWNNQRCNLSLSSAAEGGIELIYKRPD